MLFVTGLLTYLALSSAGGDHIKGGGHHGQGADGASSGVKSVVKQLTQEEAVPYSFNIDTGASFGTKVYREEAGDGEGNVKGFYTLSNPRGPTRVVEYVADDTGFHANVKTSEPNIKSHSPANAQIEAVPKTGSKSGSASQIVEASGQGGIKTVSGSDNSRVADREPTARPVRQPIVKTVSGSNQKKAAVAPSRQGITYKRPAIQPVEPRPFIGGVPTAPVFDGGIQYTGGAKEVIVYEDGSIVEVGPASGNYGNIYSTSFTDGSIINGQGINVVRSQQPKVQISQPGPIPAPRAPYGSIYTSGGYSNTWGTSNTGSRFAHTRPGVVSPTYLGGNIQYILGGSPGSVSPIRPAPKPFVSSQNLPTISEDLLTLNRQLIRKQETGGFNQAFGGFVKSEGDIEGISISLDQLSDISKRVKYDAPKPKLQTTQLRKPDQPKVKYTSYNAAVSGGASRLGAAQKPKVDVQSVLAAKPQISPQKLDLGTDLKTINRKLIQKQEQSGLQDVLDADTGIEGISFLLEGLGDISKSVLTQTNTPVRPVSQISPVKPVQPKAPVVIRPKYTSSQVTSGQRTVLVRGPQDIPASPQILQTTEGVNPIIAINRQLIQKQDGEGFRQTFGGVFASEGDLEGISISLGDLSSLSGYDINKPFVDPSQLRPVQNVELRKPIIAKPVHSERTSPVSTRSQAISGASRTSTGVQRTITTTSIQPAAALRSPQSYPVGNVPYGSRISVIPKSPSVVQRRQPIVQNSPSLPSHADDLPKAQAGVEQKSRPDVSYRQTTSGVSDEIVKLNRDLIQRQNEDGILKTFGGIVKSDESDLSGVSVSEEDLSKWVGARLTRPQLYQSADRYGGSDQRIIEQSKVVTGLIPADEYHGPSAVNQDDSDQLQIKIDDSVAQFRELPDLLRENVPFQGYVPPLSTAPLYNYRIPPVRGPGENPSVQEEAKLEQILL